MMSITPLKALNESNANTRSESLKTPTNALNKNCLLPFSGKENGEDKLVYSGKKSNRRVVQTHTKKLVKKKKEKLSALCKTPPSLIKIKNRDYFRGNFLGEGGFARCFQIKDDSGKIFAAKTVAKVSINSEKARNKLLSEIQIHKNIKHPNIVEFVDCFEDDVNVYILLEICCNGSLMDLLKKRKLLTEPEVKYFTTQICGALKFMHSNNIIHRDIKLGNIFFDYDFNLKIGDFGLAAILDKDHQRKYTVCGTPNYIAPEIIIDKHVGHSFEVDIWSMGVMIFAMLTGKPPFQSKEISIIYEKIKSCDYIFPIDKFLSREVKALIQDILVISPAERPSITKILNYNWFKINFPCSITSSVIDEFPMSFVDISSEDSIKNFKACLLKSGIITLNVEASNNVSSKIYKNSIAQFANKFIFNKHEESVKTVSYDTTTNFNLLPLALSPNNTKNCYKEVWSSNIKKNVAGNRNRAELSNVSNVIKSKFSSKILANECYVTLTNLINLESMKSKNIDETFKTKNPIIVTKWVDHSTKHGFAYQLSTEDIGLLFNNGKTLLKLADADECWYINNDDNQGWIANHFNLNDLNVKSFDDEPTNGISTLKKNLIIIDFFHNYMKDNLTRVSTFVREEYHENDVFLRRYTRCNEFMMFELSDGTFQFNFKDHYKVILSDNGMMISIVTPNQTSISKPLHHILNKSKLTKSQTNIIENSLLFDKLQLVKQLLNQKSHGISK